MQFAKLTRGQRLPVRLPFPLHGAANGGAAVVHTILPAAGAFPANPPTANVGTYKVVATENQVQYLVVQHNGWLIPAVRLGPQYAICQRNGYMPKRIRPVA